MTTKPTAYRYERGTDGTDETFDILKPDGSHLVSVHFWEAEAEAEADARLITDALNAFSLSNTAT